MSGSYMDDKQDVKNEEGIPLKYDDHCHDNVSGSWFKNNIRVQTFIMIAVVLSTICGVFTGGFFTGKKYSTTQPNGDCHHRVLNSMADPRRSNRTDITDGTCLYITPQEQYEDLTRLAFEKMCNPGSEYFKIACPENKGHTDHHLSSHMCWKCKGNAQRLPKICFCDEVMQCKEPSKSDHERKYNCTFCLEALSNRVNKEGNSTCSNTFDRTPIDFPTCRDGYNGTMCVVISKRICKPVYELDLPLCQHTNEEDCTFVDSLQNKWHCKAPKDDESSKLFKRCNVS